MMKQPRISAVALAIVLAVGTMPARADWVGDFYASAGAAVNVTAPQAIATQNAVGYSGGGLSWRVPNKNLRPFSITPPSLKAGCGGIDAYLGAYSFPNKDEFVQALRNFGQAAIGYFFELALRTMAPEIAVTLDVINDLAQRVNQFGINSCQSAKLAVGSLASQFGMTAQSDAAGFARSVGTYVDEFAANFDIKTDFSKTLEQKYKRNYNKVEAALTPDDAGKFNPVKTNVLRYALDYADAAHELTDDEKDLIMSIVGPTLIITSKADSEGKQSPEVSGQMPTLKFNDLIGNSKLDSTTLEQVTILKCDALPLCLNPNPVSVAIMPFALRVMGAINKIRQGIQTRTAIVFPGDTLSGIALSPDEAVVLKLSSVPIYRAAAMAESAGIAAIVGDQIVYDLADYAAIDAAVNMVNYYLGAADKQLAIVEPKIDTAYHPQLKAMRDRIVSIKTDMHRQATHYYQQKGDPFLKIEQLDKAERAMYSNLNSMLAANARFGRRQ